MMMMMMRSAIVIASSLAAGCATAAVPTEDAGNWCFSEPQPSPSTILADAEIHPVRNERMKKAIGSLRERTVIALRAGEAARLLPAGAAMKAGRYYLVRGSTYALPGASVEELIRIARNARIEVVDFANAPDLFIATSQRDTPDGSRAQNIALVLRTERKVERVFVGCYAVR
jgi:hypothetical protein